MRATRRPLQARRPYYTAVAAGEPLSPNSHHPEDICFGALASLEGRLAVKQNDSLHVIKRDIYPVMLYRFRRKFLQRFRSKALPPSVFDMQRLITLFSDIFFLGSLINVQFEWEWEMEARRNLVGSSSYGTSGVHKIKIDPGHCLKQKEPVSYLVGVLLHECTHTIFNMYTCHFHQFYSQDYNKGCREEEIEYLGRKGHGISWRELAEHVEAFAKDKIDENIHLRTAYFQHT
jgi:hypothetical protein